jgi:hypothetical protein
VSRQNMLNSKQILITTPRKSGLSSAQEFSPSGWDESKIKPAYDKS